MAILLGPPSKQIYMRTSLLEARESILHGAVLRALGAVDPGQVAKDLDAVAPQDARRTLARHGIRDELVFATPTVLAHAPTTLGYYRLLYGVSKKQFYTKDAGLTRFQRAEEQGELGDGEAKQLPELCTALNGALALLVAALGASIGDADIAQLPLLTLGVQFDGAHRNVLGQTATRQVFQQVKKLLSKAKVAFEELGETGVLLTNSAGRSVRIVLASDPDLVVSEDITDDEQIMKVAVEIKGGTDRSNVHNRAGEAEKSHQKVKGTAGDFWTVISLKGATLSRLKEESPTTRHWFDIAEITSGKGSTWTDFKNRLAVAIGVAL